MAYTISDPQSGFLPITAVDSGVVPANNFNTGSTTTVPTPPMKPGMVVTATDPTYGGGEFILLAGVTGTIVGSVVNYNASTYTTVLAPTASAIPTPIAFAMATNVSPSTWGWYQIGGNVIASKLSGTSINSGVAIGVTTTGTIGATATGNELQGAWVAATATTTATTIQLMVNRPHNQGRIT